MTTADAARCPECQALTAEGHHHGCQIAYVRTSGEFRGLPPTADERVDHPPHYGGDTTYEAIKVIEAWQLDFCLGNTVKYIARAGKKGDALEDLRKSAWYLQRRIEQLEKET